MGRFFCLPSQSVAVLEKLSAASCSLKAARSQNSSATCLPEQLRAAALDRSLLRRSPLL